MRRGGASGGGAAPPSASPANGVAQGRSRPAAAGAGGGGGAGAGVGQGGRDDQRHREMVLSEIMVTGPNVTWEDIAGERVFVARLTPYTAVSCLQ